MKTIKIVLIAVLSVFIVSCSSDDDATLSPDPIIGSWKLLANSSGPLNDCQARTFVTLNANSTWSSTSFNSSNNSSNPCSLSSMQNGAWENKGNGNYNLALSNGDVLAASISFANNNNSFNMILSQGDQEVTLSYERIVNEDPIIGKWSLVSASLNGIQEEMNDCRRNTTLFFFVNNTTYAEEHSLNQNETACIIEQITIGNWEKTNNGTYVDTTQNDAIELDIVFSSDLNTFTLTVETMIGDTPFVITRAYRRANQ